MIHYQHVISSTLFWWLDGHKVNWPMSYCPVWFFFTWFGINHPLLIWKFPKRAPNNHSCVYVHLTTCSFQKTIFWKCEHLVRLQLLALSSSSSAGLSLSSKFRWAQFPYVFTVNKRCPFCCGSQMRLCSLESGELHITSIWLIELSS